MTDEQFYAAWNRLNSKPDRVRVRYFLWVAYLMRSQPLPF